ncbi:MAG TPA: hypothetical protein V6C57_24975, partial [Coleofasciculaceae cyanobacterium]
EPEIANLDELWQLIEPALERLPSFEQLQLAGKAIAQLAKIYQLRADRLLADWEESHNDAGPLISDDLLAGLIQKTMYLDISDLIRKPKARQRRKGVPEEQPAPSIAEVVEKEQLLALIDVQEAEQAKQAALAVAHAEDVSKWIAAIAQWMAQQPQHPAIQLGTLQQAVGLAQVEVWLAVLLSEQPGYEWEQRGEFYDTEGLWLRQRG